jgi:hypothetical protein
MAKILKEGLTPIVRRGSGKMTRYQRADRTYPRQARGPGTSSGTHGYAWHASSRDVDKEHNAVIDRATILCQIEMGSKGDALMLVTLKAWSP